jgi:glycosyltransferase involved in cell wall biosynthesis
MHVCYVIHHPYPANHSTATNEYTQKLVECGVDVSIIAARDSNTVLEHEVISGVDVHRILTDTSTSVSAEPTLFAYRAFKKFNELDQSHDFDVLHLRAFPNLGVFLRPPLWLDSPPVLADVRGTAVSNRFFDVISRYGIRLQRRLVEKIAVIDSNVVNNIWNNPPSDIGILPLGVDFERFEPGENDHLRASWDIGPNEILFGYTGNLHSSRRLERLIDSFAEAAKQTRDIELIIVGSGRAGDTLRQHAIDRDIDDIVTFTGEVPFQKVPEYLQAFDVGLAYVPNQPQYRDQPPLKTAEFLAAGLPIVATDTAGNRRFITPGENALAVDDDPQEYTSAIVELATDSKKRAELSSGARQSVKKYDYKNIVEHDLLPMYKEIMRREAP